MPLPFWRHPEHRIPTLGLYRTLLRTSLDLPSSCVDQPGRRRRPVASKGLSPPGSSDPLPKPKRSYLFALIRDRFRTNRQCTSPRITAGYLREAEDALTRLEKAKDGDREIRKELHELVNGRTGRLKEVVDHLHDLISFEAGETTQRSRFKRLKRAQEQVWDTRPQSSIEKDPSPCYRIPLKPALFQFPPELDYYPPAKYPNQMKNRRGKFKNFGGVFLTEVTTSEGSRFPRIRGGTQPEWISMMLKARVAKSVIRVDEWKNLEEVKKMMEVEETLMKRLGVDDVGYVDVIDERLKSVRSDHARRRYNAKPRDNIDASLEDVP